MTNITTFVVKDPQTLKTLALKVDSTSIPDLNSRKWSLSENDKPSTSVDGRPIRLHRWLKIHEKRGGRVTFIDGDETNCTLANLRIAERGQGGTMANPVRRTRPGSARPAKHKSGQFRVELRDVEAYVVEVTDRNGVYKQVAVSFSKEDAIAAAFDAVMGK